MFDKKIKSEVLQYFFEFYPDLPDKMRNTLHSYDKDNRSPFHLEDDVWSHTLIAFSHLNISNFIIVQKYAACVATLCHDIGKIFTRSSHKEGRINFWGHAQVSVQYTIDFSLFVSEKLNWNENKRNKLVELASYAVNNHFDLFRKKDDDVSSYLNYRQDIMEVLYAVCEADMAGQIKHTDLFNSPDIKINFKFQEELSEKEFNKEGYDRVAFVFCGVPGVGKDTVASKLKSKVFSYDDIRREVLNKHYPSSKSLSPSKEYDFAWFFCNEANIDLDKTLYKKLRDFSGNVSICNLNLTRKSRRRILGVVDRAFKGEKVLKVCVYIVSDSNTILDRNINRKNDDKSIPRKVIYDKLYGQYLPSEEEGFDQVIFIVN